MSHWKTFNGYLMFEHAFKKFSDDKTVIQTAAIENDDFHEILNDYEEICTYLAAQSADNKAGAAELSVARETASALEKEIEEFLAKQ